MTVYIGIDPGFKGAVAFLNDNGGARVEDAPTFTIGKSKREHDIHAMVELLMPFSVIGKAAIEKVHSMPKQGRASVFTFGKGFGIWLGILAACGIPFEEITPQRWQGAMMDGMQRGKDASRLRATQLFPYLADELKLKSNDGRADALLIAEFRRRLG